MLGPVPRSVALADSAGPNIEGIRTYRGTLVHTANWDPSIDWRGKRVAVIGTGSSSVQIVPQLVNGSRETRLSNPPVTNTDPTRCQILICFRAVDSMDRSPGCLARPAPVPRRSREVSHASVRRQPLLH